LLGPGPQSAPKEILVTAHAQHESSNAYTRLGIELAIDFAIMYLVMYTMIATIDHLRLNLNNVYMTLMMVSPMAIVMMVSMDRCFRPGAPTWSWA
jgi:hypothetical protein